MPTAFTDETPRFEMFPAIRSCTCSRRYADDAGGRDTGAGAAFGEGELTFFSGSGVRAVGGGLARNIANKSAFGVGVGVGVGWGVEGGVALGDGVGVGCVGCGVACGVMLGAGAGSETGCACAPSTSNECWRFFKSIVGSSFPSCVGMGAIPNAGNSLAAIEFAFDSNVFSLGSSFVSVCSVVSINGVFFGPVGGVGIGATSTMVNSTGFSSSGSEG